MQKKTVVCGEFGILTLGRDTARNNFRREWTMFSLTSLAVSAAFILILTASAQAEPPTANVLDRASLDWISKERIRAGYCNRWTSEELPVKLAAAGFNTLHVQFCNAGHGDIQRWGRLARENNLRLITSVWWSYPSHRQSQQGVPARIGTSYRGFVNSAGRSHTMTVCPVDERYWQDWIMPDPLEMARQARGEGICGITLDPEFYGSAEPDGGGSYGWYYFSGMCHCDHCFGNFLETTDATETPAEVAPPDRAVWLEQHGHLRAYDDNLKNNVQVLARRLERAVHVIDPDVVLGFLAVYDASDFFSRGLRDGFQTPNRPVTIWPETPTYNKGYHPYVDEVYRKLRSSGNVVYVPGLYLEAHAPMKLNKQAHDLAMHSDGYWVFTNKTDLLMNATVGSYFRGANNAIANAAPASDEAPFVDLWDQYKPVATLPAQWLLRLDPQDIGEQKTWYAPEVQTNDWRTVNIGQFWEKTLGQPYIGVGWYRVAVNVPELAAGKRLYLAFGAVDEQAWVWVNGESAGAHAVGPQGWNRRFLIEVTEQLKPGHENVIAVRVHNSLAAGGIWKPVRIIARR